MQRLPAFTADLGGRDDPEPRVSEMKRSFRAVPFCVVLGVGLSCCSLAAERVGDSSRAITVGGLRRTFLIHPPHPQKQATRLPLLIVLHGAGSNGEGMVKLTLGEFDSMSDKEGFIVVYPDGVDKHWNDARPADEAQDRAHEDNIDDVGFISALIDTMVEKENVDPRRVYVTGISNGAIMSFRLACELSNKITAIAPVDGNIPVNEPTQCSSQQPVSVLITNGTKDPLVHWEGGEVTGPFGFKKLGKLLSTTETVQFWVRHDRCKAPPDSTIEPDSDPDDGTRVTRTEYGGGNARTSVVLYTIVGGGHTWPGGRQYLPAWIVGRTCRDIDACKTIWDFFRTKARQQ